MDFVSTEVRTTLITMPRDTNVQAKFDPPALIKGSALPATGTRRTIIPTLINASKVIQDVSPAASNAPNMSGAFRDMTEPRREISTYIKMISVAMMAPVSWITTTKMVSREGMGKPVHLRSDLPMPTPNKPPLTMPSNERFT